MSRASAAPAALPRSICMAGPAAAASPIIAGCSIPNVSMRCCSTSAAAGRSRPKGRREANTLPHLIADMETIREKFGFERWMMVGGSWGATLALAYAQAHPDRVTGIVLRATFLGTYEEIEDGFLQRAAALLSRPLRGFPRACCRKRNARSRSTPIGAASSIPIPPCMARRRGPGTRPSAFFPSTRRRARGSIWPRSIRRGALPATPFMEAHYFANDCFMRPNQLLRRSRQARRHSRHHRAGPLRPAVPARDLACARRALAGG